VQSFQLRPHPLDVAGAVVERETLAALRADVGEPLLLVGDLRGQVQGTLGDPVLLGASLVRALVLDTNNVGEQNTRDRTVDKREGAALANLCAGESEPLGRTIERYVLGH
jgi:hypothetical protein